MSQIYGPLRATLTAEEAELYQVTIREQAREDNPARAARFGLSPEALGLPEVKADDLVADAALYEILYASEIGQDQTYLGDLFTIFGILRRRPEALRIYRQGLTAVDRRFAPELRNPGEPAYETWRASAGYRKWWAARAEFLQVSRGQTIAIARTLALVKRGAFVRAGRSGGAIVVRSASAPSTTIWRRSSMPSRRSPAFPSWPPPWPSWRPPTRSWPTG